MAVDETVEKNAEQEEERELTTAKGQSTPGRRNRPTKRQEGGNFIVRNLRGIREYLSGVQDELDKVVWPTREELIRLTRIVTAVTIAASIGLGTVSIGLTRLFRAGLQNELIFVIFGVVVVATYFAVRQYIKREREQQDIAQF
ncbi:MAG: preprotein translocase subunit SecE [Anaerolineaceae bacterium]|nr:MAG: preprotein translocase subunit SecE [Anaerolineaceae bacterium]